MILSTLVAVNDIRDFVTQSVIHVLICLLKKIKSKVCDKSYDRDVYAAEQMQMQIEKGN